MNLVCAYCGVRFPRAVDSQRDCVSPGLHTWGLWAALLISILGLVVYLVVWQG